MIRSATQGDNASSWDDILHSSKPAERMLDSAFGSLTISDMHSERNRPPALSVSSISSIGEEINKGADLPNYYGSHPPSSPLSNVSTRNNHFLGKSNLNSPIGTSVRQVSLDQASSTTGTGTTISYQDTAASGNNIHGGQAAPYSLTNFKYPPFDTPGFSSQSLPTFKELAEDSDSTADYSNGCDKNTIRSDHETQFLKIHRNNSDLSDKGSTHSAFRNWPSSSNLNARSTHSLTNMGSVDENEQFLGNRARARSATAALGYHTQHKYPTGTSNNPAPATSLYGAEEGDNTNLGLVLGTSSHTGQAPRTHSHEDMGVYNTRQRVMSADAVHNSSLRNQQAMYDGQSRIQNTFSYQSYNDQQHFHSRPRSYSSGTTNYVSSPNFRSVPPPPRYDFGVVPQGQTYANGHMTMGDVNGLQGVMSHPQDVQQSNYSPNQSVSRAYMYEQQYRMQEMSFTNQDRIIRLQQSYGSSESLPYYHSRDPHIAMQPTPRTVYTVKFKRSQKNFFLSKHIQGDIKIGSYVKVEADRGEDLGVVLSRIPIEKFNPGARLNTPNLDIPDLQLKRITRLASNAEIAHLGLKEEEEAELLKICRSKTLQRGLPMNVVDAEYQFDRHKLTFFFEANCRVDFRELVRDLFSIYKTRIWMQQIDKVPGSAHPVGATSIVGTEALPVYGFEGQPSGGNDSIPAYGVDALATNAGAGKQAINGVDTD